VTGSPANALKISLPIPASCDSATDYKTRLQKENQDYAARFALSSEAFKQLFETAFLHVT
jgi:hypothetical protein